MNGIKNRRKFKMDIKSGVIEIIDELFMEDVSDMMDEDLFDAVSWTYGYS